jgi:transposase
VTVELPDARTRWRCAQCGNLTRFDVVRSSRVREFWHLDLAGEPTVEQADTLSETIESVACRWCGPSAVVELVRRPDGDGS